jgi:hypothetical protein
MHRDARANGDALRDVITDCVLSRARSSRRLAAMKWKNAWSHSTSIFTSFTSTTGFTRTDGPTTQQPTQYGVNGKPVVMGEFRRPLEGPTTERRPSYWYRIATPLPPWQTRRTSWNCRPRSRLRTRHACVNAILTRAGQGKRQRRRGEGLEEVVWYGRTPRRCSRTGKRPRWTAGRARPPLRGGVLPTRAGARATTATADASIRTCRP